MIRAQRIASVLALAALIGGPVAGTVCAMWCAPHRALARHAASQSHHCQPTDVVASVAATGCNTHSTPDRDLEATLIAPRSHTHSPIAIPATVFDRAAFTLASALLPSSAHGPPLDTSQTPRTRSLVLRI